MAGGFHRALGALLLGRKAKPELESLAIMNHVSLAAKGINLCSEVILHYSACTGISLNRDTFFFNRDSYEEKSDDFYSNK